MTAAQLLQLVAEALYVLVFLVVAIRAARFPHRANVDMALFFGVSAFVIAESHLTAALAVRNPLWSTLGGALIMTLPYLLLRLVDDFLDVPALLLRGAEVGLALAVISLFVFRPAPLVLTLLLVLYFVGLQVYSAVAFMRGARRAGGVTRRRMQAVAAGSLFLGLNILVAGLAAAPDLRGLASVMSPTFAALSGLAYFIGFAPPLWLRRAWQEPELRAFLSRAAHLPRLPDTTAILDELEQGTASSVGAPHAAIGLWDREAGRLQFREAGAWKPLPDGDWTVQRVFDTQRPIFAADAARRNPSYAPTYAQYDAGAVLAAPITAGERRLGVVTVYAPRAPIFADSDLELVQLLADQAAVILESRALIDEAARVRAQEEVTRIKDDFLSAAAHDLKTPLTTILMQAQLMARRAQRQPDTPIDLAGVQRIEREAKRLNRLVHDLLDASRAEQGHLLGAREAVDLVVIAHEVCDIWQTRGRECVVEAEGPVVAEVDRARMTQLVENLVENGFKYSPDGGAVRIRVWQEGREARLDVTDQGIGIAASDMPSLFDRFKRGDNVDDRRFAGMGLGLFICRGIAEQHDGRIWATSGGPGRGSTFHVALPLTVEVAHA